MMRPIQLAVIALAALCLGRSATGAIVPVGIQSSVSQATVDSWGWTEIHRSDGGLLDVPPPLAPILSAATGDHLMMGVWDLNTQRYEILGAGETSVVTAITYAHYSSDDNGTTLNNWSNGLNFYRTSGRGAWGFTTNNVTELNYSDVFLLDGLQAQNGQTEGVLTKGLSFYIDGSHLVGGWAYNVTGNDVQAIAYNGTREIVFFTDAVPEPSSIVVLAGLLATFGLFGWWKKRKQAAT